MKRSLPLPFFFLLATLAAAWPCRTVAAAQSPAPACDLNSVLAQMNSSASTFKTAQADFEFESYQKVVDEKDLQKGRIYFRRSGKGNVEVAFNVSSPSPKQALFKNGKVFTYEPKVDLVTEYDFSRNKAKVEAFLSLGFGARGDDLEKSYGVTLAGWEPVDAVRTAKLELIPKDEKTRQTYSKIILWIDPEKDVLLKQQLIEPSGDYRLARYLNMKLNGKLSDDDFQLKTTGKTRTVRPQ
jgi:outer membrane lipoprotein-sorting protein